MSNKNNNLVSQIVLKTSKNFIIDTAIPTASKKVDFNDRVTIADIIERNHHVHRKRTIAMRDHPVRTARNDDVTFEHLRWKQVRRQGLQSIKTNSNDKHSINIAANIYDNLHNDELTSYGNYKQPWMLDTGATGHYADRRTRVRRRRKTRNGIRVGCANGNVMTQVEEGELPFDKLPTNANDVQIFDHMNVPLISGGKLVTNDCNIVFDTPNAHVLTGETKDMVRQIIADAENNESDDILMTVPFDNNTLTWKTTPDTATTASVANIVHRIRLNEILVDYLHQAAGYPVKKTFLQAIK